MNRKGFTLIELLVAACLFLTATASFGYILKTGASSTKTADHLNQAAYTLQAKMEEIRGLPFEQLLALNEKKFADGQGEISTTLALVDLVKIELELAWDAKKKSIKCTSLRSKY